MKAVAVQQTELVDEENYSSSVSNSDFSYHLLLSNDRLSSFSYLL